MTTTLAPMRASVTSLLNETPDAARLDGAINDALIELWQNLMLADPQKYCFQQPELLVNPADIIPFEELGAMPYIEHSAVSHIYTSWYEYDAADSWERKADGHLHLILQLVIQQSERQDSIEAYTPYQIVNQYPKGT